MRSHLPYIYIKVMSRSSLVWPLSLSLLKKQIIYSLSSPSQGTYERFPRVFIGARRALAPVGKTSKLRQPRLLPSPFCFQLYLVFSALIIIIISSTSSLFSLSSFSLSLFLSCLSFRLKLRVPWVVFCFSSFLLL